MPHRLTTTVAALSILLLLPSLPAQEGPGGERGGKEKKRDRIKPYDQVITEDAKTDPGFFIVHRVGDELYYEIKPERFGRELLWVTQIARTLAGHGYGGTPVGNRVVRWELRGDDVLLREVRFAIRADGGAVRRAVEATSLAPIIKTFPVKAWGKDKSPVIDVTALFTEDVPEFSPKRRLGASSLDRKRTFLESVLSFPTNVETQVLATYKLKSGSDGAGRSPRRRRRGSRRDAVSVVLHHSMVELPSDPMTPRRHDARVGFFTVSFEDYGDDGEHQVEDVRYVTRWRLEKEDPGEDVSEPKEPIVFYVGRGVPEKWRPWVKKGIESWQPAFEAAGFRNAILAKDPPSPKEDPGWHAEDARYSTIRWLPSTIENAMGPHVHDPRTGEILEADILMYHNVLKLVRDWYFVQASPNDPRAQKLPLPDDLVGELLAYVVAHEVGHSLGFPHNMKASSSFTVEQLRDPEFTRRNGTEASIMDYGRFNYVAQPGDGAALIPKIGPYDVFAVEWGYRQYGDDEAERKGLAALVARQKDDPVLRFGGANPSVDPSQQTEDLGSDPIEATRLGLANIRRVARYLVEATCRPGEDYELLSNMYEELVSQMGRELGHVTAIVGGVVHRNLWYGDAERRYEALSAARQREAVAFLLENGFQTPKELLAPDIVDRLESHGTADRILRGHRRLLGRLMADGRIKRMAELVERKGDDAYPPVELLGDLRLGIWRELEAERVRIGLVRRNLQRLHVDLLTKAMEKRDVSSDLPALARGELGSVAGAIREALPRADQPATRLHLTDTEARIRAALDPTKGEGRSSGAGGATPNARRGGARAPGSGGSGGQP